MNNYYIEVVARWTEFKHPENGEDAKLRRLLDTDDAEKQEMVHTYSEISLDIYDISRWNKSNTKDCTTLTMKDGSTYVIKLPYDVFLDYYQDITGRNVVRLEYVEDLTQESSEGEDLI